MYTNSQLNTIYSYLGFQFYLDFEPEIKSVIIATQSTADGGAQPDNSLELKVLSIVTLLQGVDQQLDNLVNLAFVEASSSGAIINVPRGEFLLRKFGRRYIKQLCIIFALKGVRQDYYGGAHKVGYEEGGMSYFPDDWE